MKTQSFVPNSTQVPHLLLRHFMHLLKDTEFKCLMMICDQTYGWQREVDAIALSQFQNGITARDGTQVCCGTGASRPSIVDALKRLTESGLIETYKGNTNKYQINLNCDIDQARDYLAGKTPPVTFATPKVKKPKEEVALPDWLDKETWALWVKNRKEKRKELTPTAIELQIKKLEAIGIKDHKRVIIRAIDKGWQTFYPINDTYEPHKQIQKQAREVEDEQERKRNTQDNQQMQKLSEQLKSLVSRKKV